MSLTHTPFRVPDLIRTRSHQERVLSSLCPLISLKYSYRLIISSLRCLILQ